MLNTWSGPKLEIFPARKGYLGSLPVGDKVQLEALPWKPSEKSQRTLPWLTENQTAGAMSFEPDEQRRRRPRNASPDLRNRTPRWSQSPKARTWRRNPRKTPGFLRRQLHRRGFQCGKHDDLARTDEHLPDSCWGIRWFGLHFPRGQSSKYCRPVLLQVSPTFKIDPRSS